jgi:Transposase, Mutator family
MIVCVVGFVGSTKGAQHTCRLHSCNEWVSTSYRERCDTRAEYRRPKTLGEPYEGKPHVRFDEGVLETETTVRSSGTLARKGRNGLGLHDLPRSPRQRPTLQMRNVLDHLPERQRPWVQTILRRAYQSPDVKTATRLLQDLARRLEDEYPSAAESVREGLEETLTVIGLGLSQRLQRSLATTNAAESLISRTRHVKRNVKRWRGGKMMLRWVAAGVLEAVKGFRRLKGHRDMPTLVAKLRTRDQQLGLAKAEEKVA